jgi:acetoacetyl-CoA synthetase
MQLDDVELAGQFAGGRRDDRSCTTAIQTYPDAGAMWKLIQDEKNRHLRMQRQLHTLLEKGKCIAPCGVSTCRPCARFRKRVRRSPPMDLNTCTRRSKPDLHFNSIAGGTDINGCFAAGSPIVPCVCGRVAERGAGNEDKILR